MKYVVLKHRCKFILLYTIKTVVYFTFLHLLCEYYIYNIKAYTCSWPKLDPKNADLSIKDDGEKPVKVMLLTDLHLISPNKGHWFENARTQWHMHCSFQSALSVHQPEVVFILGDLFDWGLTLDQKEFNYLTSLFYHLFSVPKETELYIVAGNHDIGFHFTVRKFIDERFKNAFDAPSAGLLTIRNNHFVFINSMALADDGCFLCNKAKKVRNQIDAILTCTQNPTFCKTNVTLNGKALNKYSRPILVQHLPLFRRSDKHCSGIDAAPLKMKNTPFRPEVDCLTQKQSDKLLNMYNPRVAFAGHIHHGCVTQLENGGVEYTLPTFNRMHISNPNYALAVFSPNNFALNKCELPRKFTIDFLYIAGILFYISYLVYCYTKHTRSSVQYRTLNIK